MAFQYDDYEASLTDGILSDDDFNNIIIINFETNNNINNFDKRYYFYNYYKHNREYLLNKQAIKKPCLYCNKQMRYDYLNKHINKYCKYKQKK